jgi:cytochrome b involved in lipid metabolism
VIDSIVYDLSGFVDLHPGGAAVLLSKDVGQSGIVHAIAVTSLIAHRLFPAGQEATAAFYGLHRGEVLQNPRYAAYRIGSIEGEKEKIIKPRTGQLSQVPYAEPMSLTPSYKASPYFKPSHYAVQKGERMYGKSFAHW